MYDRRGRETFGRYPPYQLANFDVGGSVATALEAENPASDRLAERLWRDVGAGQGSIDSWVRLPNEGDSNDDIRALFAYLRLFTPEALRLVPEDRLKPINPRQRDYVNPKGTGGEPGTAGGADWVEILAIHDAWDVPLDYMLYAKLEWRVPPGGGDPEWVVTERRPVLRSRGIDREAYDAWVQSNRNDPPARALRLSPPDKWIFSEELPRPWLGGGEPGNIAPNGVINVSGTQFNGWVRVVGLAEQYAYRPDGDEP